jgi:hypothetical protein
MARTLTLPEIIDVVAVNASQAFNETVRLSGAKLGD